MNILVTGANGQLGQELRGVVGSNLNEYLFTDKEELDISDLAALDVYLERHECGVIVNCAAYTDVDKAEDDSVAADLLNNKAVGNLAMVAKKRGATLIHISTDYLFSGEANVPYNEESRVDPLGVYGKTKLAGEIQILKSRCKHIIIRTSWLYSPYGNNFVKKILALLKEKENVKVVVDQVGTPTSAEDLAHLIYDIIERDRLDKQGVYHYSNEGLCSWYDFAQEIREYTKSACRVEPCHSEEFPSRVTRPHYSVLDKTKIRQTFDLNIPYWRDSLKRCLDRLTTSKSTLKKTRKSISKPLKK